MRTDRAGGIRRRARIKPPAVNFSVYFPLRLPRPRLSNPKTWVRMPRQGDSPTAIPTAIPTVDFLNRPRSCNIWLTAHSNDGSVRIG